MKWTENKNMSVNSWQNLVLALKDLSSYKAPWNHTTFHFILCEDTFRRNFSVFVSDTQFIVKHAATVTSAMAEWLRAFALEAGRLASILSRVKPKTLKLVSAVTLAKRSAIECIAQNEINKG